MNRFKMLARDHNSSPTQYRTWVVPNQPDFTGNQYFGLKSGPTPFNNVTTEIILDDTVVADFNLPSPQSWIITERVIPENIQDAQLAVIDGYVYLFGGFNLDKIFRTTLDNPADWEDTGAVLPEILSSSQFAIVNNTIYLFGGRDGYGATDHIFSASLSNPLSWTDHGALLPAKVQDHQLIITDGYLYLLGGRNDTGAISTIMQADVNSPLTWSSVGNLVNPLYSSHVGIVDGYIYLFGGFISSAQPTTNIYSASVNNATSWSLTGNLPIPAFNGQFFTIGTKGYLISPTDSTTSLTRILRCNLSSPNLWIDTKSTIPGMLYSSHFAIIGDRLFLIGGNANTSIYADSSILKYDFASQDVISYGHVTRTLVNNTPDRLDLFSVLGFPYWKTSYVS